jgi:hypothetical protein
VTKKSADSVADDSSPAQVDEGGRAEAVARKIYAAVAAVIAARVARMAVERAWVKVTGKVPPEEPESPKVHWAEAVGWSALSGTSVAVARLLASRRAAGAWQRVSEQSPTGKPEAKKSPSRDST